MTKRLNIIFICITMLFLMGVMLSVVLSPLPVGSEPTKSLLENRNYTQLPTKERKAMFVDGRLQDVVDKWLSDSVPYRDNVMLANAALQRSEIKVANLLLNYPVYPTYLNSDRVASSNTGAIYMLPAKLNTHPENEVFDAADRISKLVKDHPDINWAFYLVDNTEVSLANPASTLVSEHLDYSALLDLLQPSLQDAGVFVIDGGYNSEDEYLVSFFHTDHHMQVQGGVQMYEAIMYALGKQPLQFGSFQVAYSKGFYGSDAKAGLDVEKSDVIWDVDYTPSDLRVAIDGSHVDKSALDKGLLNGKPFVKSANFANVYGEYFHNDYKTVIIENPQIDESAGSLLLISDSYDNSTSRLYAESYRFVYEVSVKNGIDLDAFIKSHPDIVDAAFILCPGYLKRVCVVD